MRVGVIINPVSGRHGRDPSTGPRRVDVARRVLRDAGVDGEIEVTRGAGDAAMLARSFADRGAELVVAWGGDGTINQAAGPLIGSTVALGIIPSGSGDGFAESIGIVRPAEAAWTQALGPVRLRIDVGYLGERHFLNVAGSGFDAAVAQRFNSRKKRGGLGYLTSGLPLLWGYQCTHYTVTLDDRTLTGPRFVVAFANGCSYGNRAVIAASADPTDGWLDVVMGDAGPFWQQIWRSRRLSFRRLSPARGITRLRVREATLAGERMVCHVDGETFETGGTLPVRIRPAALTIAGASPARFSS
jgi:YegS/Rv2252/BmrU family lipid kinase